MSNCQKIERPAGRRRRTLAAAADRIERQRLRYFYARSRGQVISWNAGAEHIKGYRTEEIVGQHFSCFHLEEDIRHVKPPQEIHTASRVGTVEDEGWRVRTDRSKFCASAVVTALWDSAAQLKGFAKVTRDITEWRRPEQIFRGLLEVPPDAVVALNKSGEIVLLNTQVETLFGDARQELRGHTIEMQVPERFRAKHLLHRETLVGENRVRPMALQVLKELKTNPFTKPIPIATFPAPWEEQDAVTSYHSRVNGYNESPVNFEQFRRNVNQLVPLWPIVNQSSPPRAFQGG